jgi:hypothetical protein
MALSAAEQACPLLEPVISCVCRVGCAYDAEFWLHNSDSPVYKRPAIADMEKVCGLTLFDWLSARAGTKFFPVIVRTALKQWSVAKLNLANFGCASPLEADAAAYEAFVHIDSRFVRESSDDECVNHPADEDLPYYATLLSQWNAGARFSIENNTLSPCACAETSCAQQFGLVESTSNDDGGAVGGHTTVSAETNSGLEVPQRWDTLKLVFFIVCCVLVTALAVLLCCGVYCCFCGGRRRMLGPTGFSMAQRPIFAPLGASGSESDQTELVQSAVYHINQF